MLQLSFREVLPCTLFTALAHECYLALSLLGDARLRDACLSVTVTELGTRASVRFRVLFACLSPGGCSIRVVTEAADMHAALRSRFAVLFGSCPLHVPLSLHSRETRRSRPSALEAECS